MEQEYVEITASDGMVIPFAIDHEYDGPVPAGRINARTAEGVKASLDTGVGLVRHIADAVSKEVANFSERPNKVSIEVGLAATASGAIVVAATSAETHINITIEWTNNSSTGT